MSDIRSQIAGEFTGYNDGAVFKLTNGQVWQQRKYNYKYKYKYRPKVRIFKDSGRVFMEFDCMEEPVEVAQVSMIEDGTITSDFNGFDGNSTFQFDSGQVCEVRVEYKYSYHYAYGPYRVVDGINGPTLYVDGMSETVRVVKIVCKAAHEWRHSTSYGR